MISRITRKGPQKSIGGNDEMISKFIQNLTEEKRTKLVQILNNNKSSYNVEEPEIKLQNSDESNEYRFTIDTFDDRVRFSKKLASSRSPALNQPVTEKEKTLINQDSSRDFFSHQKGILDIRNQNIRVMDDEPLVKKPTNKAKSGNHSVHFTPKAPEPNTILGFHEDKIEIASFGGNKNDAKLAVKGDQT